MYCSPSATGIHRRWPAIMRGTASESARSAPSVSGFGVITSRTDSSSVVETAGARNIRCTDEKALQEIFDSISAMEKVEIKEEHFREETDLYPALLLTGLVLLALAFIAMATFIHNPLEG